MQSTICDSNILKNDDLNYLSSAEGKEKRLR